MRVVFLLLIFTFSFVSGAGLSMNTYKKLDKIQKQIANKEYKKSKEDLRDLLERINNKVDKSYILQTLGSIYLAQDDYQQAIKIYKQALDLNKFPKETISQTNLLIGKLYYSLKDYVQTINYIEKHIATAKKPKADGFVVISSALIEKKEYKKAIGYLRRAIKIEPKESAYALLFSAYYYQEDYKNSKVVLEETIKRYKKLTYFTTLSSIYELLGEKENSGAILEIAYKDSLGLKEREILTLAYRLSTLRVFNKASHILEDSMKKGKVERNLKNLKSLSYFLYEAKEFEKAKKVLENLVLEFNDYETRIRLSKIYYDNDEYKKAIKLLKSQKLKPGGYLLLGACYMGMNDKNNAKEAFLKVTKDKKAIKEANRWIKFIKES